MPATRLLNAMPISVMPYLHKFRALGLNERRPRKALQMTPGVSPLKKDVARDFCPGLHGRHLHTTLQHVQGSYSRPAAKHATGKAAEPDTMYLESHIHWWQHGKDCGGNQGCGVADKKSKFGHRIESFRSPLPGTVATAFEAAPA